MELNASDDRGIQAIRDKVKSFAQKIVTKLNFDDYPFFIYYNRCNIKSEFDLNISTTYIKTPFQYLLTDIYTYTYEY